MTKEEKIKEVYGNRLEIVKDFICMHSGVVSDRQYNQIDCPTPTECNFENDECYSFWTIEDNGERVVDVFNWIPKSLQGIEDNNGWISLLNNEEEFYDYGEVELFNINTREYYICTDRHEPIELDSFTHFKPFERSKYPLF